MLGGPLRRALAPLRAGWVYDAVQDGLGAEQLRLRFARDHLRVTPGARVLDLGCGTAALRPHLGACRYAGVDASAEYLAVARRRLGPDVELRRIDLADPGTLPAGSFDAIVATGVLHHLPDAVAGALLEAAAIRLAPRGRVVTLDPAFADGAHPVATLLARMDRGRHVRTADGYRALVPHRLSAVSVHVRHDLLRVPYTHAILECAAS